MYKKQVIIAFVLFFIGCLIFWQYYSPIKKTLESNRELISVIRDIVTILTIALGGFFSYFKFFKGRTFLPKADIGLEVSLIDTPNNCILHTIKFSLTNKGTITIINPVAKLGIRSFIGNTQENEVVHDLVEKSFFDGPLVKHHRAVDVGETIFFIYQREFHASIWAVTYEVEVTSSTNHKWKNSHTIRNRIKKQDGLVM